MRLLIDFELRGGTTFEEERREEITSALNAYSVYHKWDIDGLIVQEQKVNLLEEQMNNLLDLFWHCDIEMTFEFVPMSGYDEVTLRIIQS